MLISHRSIKLIGMEIRQLPHQNFVGVGDRLIDCVKSAEQFYNSVSFLLDQRMMLNNDGRCEQAVFL